MRKYLLQKRHDANELPPPGLHQPDARRVVRVHALVLANAQSCPAHMRELAARQQWNACTHAPSEAYSRVSPSNTCSLNICCGPCTYMHAFSSNQKVVLQLMHAQSFFLDQNSIATPCKTHKQPPGHLQLFVRVIDAELLQRIRLANLGTHGSHHSQYTLGLTGTLVIWHGAENFRCTSNLKCPDQD